MSDHRSNRKRKTKKKKPPEVRVYTLNSKQDEAAWGLSSLQARSDYDEQTRPATHANGIPAINADVLTSSEIPKAPTTNNKKYAKRIYGRKESLLSELCHKDKNIEALYHVLILMILVGLSYSLIQDSVKAGELSIPYVFRLYVDFSYYFSGFGPLHMQLFMVLVWLEITTVCFMIYPFFRMWVWLYSSIGRTANILFTLLYTAYNIISHSCIIWIILHYNLFPVPSLILIIEQLRYTMKSYSFIRENAYKVLYPWHKDDDSGPAVWYDGQMSPSVGSFGQYFYYLFCPTLLYRDHYPRTERIKWTKVIGYLLKCCITIAFVTVLTKEIFSLPPTNSKNIALTFLSCGLWGLLYIFMTNYFFLHSWLNLFAELCRFADREFYSDWWTCHDFSSFYRKWNLIVHDWIKAYIYADLKNLFNSKIYNKLASLPTIAISAVFHEYVLWAPLRFIMPLLLVLFGVFGTILYFFRPSPKVKFWNYFLHFGLHLGVSLMIFCYTMEFYARNMCPSPLTFTNTFIPRSYECFVMDVVN